MTLLTGDTEFKPPQLFSEVRNKVIYLSQHYENKGKPNIIDYTGQQI